MSTFVLCLRHTLLHNIIKAGVLLTAFLLSISSGRVQAQEQSLRIDRYQPQGNGYVVENVTIEYGLGISEQGTQFAKLTWSVDEVSSDVIGYKYNGEVYNNSSAIYSSMMGDLEDILYGELKASWRIMYKGRVLKTLNDVIISGPTNAYGSIEIDAQGEIDDYAITNLRISSTHSSQHDSRIGNAIQSYQQKKKEEEAKKEQAPTGVNSPSGASSTGSSSESNTGTNESFSSTASNSSDGDENMEGASQKNFTTSSSENSAEARNRRRMEREREADEDLRNRYEGARQEHETQMAAIQGAQQGFNAALERARQNTRERYAREEAEQRRQARQRMQKEERLKSIKEEYFDRSDELESIREEYFMWLRGQIIDDPSVEYLTSLIDKQSLSENEPFYTALIEIRWRQGGSEKLQEGRDSEGYVIRDDGYVIYDYTQYLRDIKSGYNDAVVRTDGETSLMRVNSITRNNLYDITRDFWQKAKEDKTLNYEPYANRIFTIAATSPEDLRKFIDRIQPENVYGMKQDTSPNWDLWEKFASASGVYYNLLSSKSEVVNRSYELLDTFKTTYENDVLKVIRSEDTAFMQKLLEAKLVSPSDEVEVDGQEVGLLAASLMLDKPEMLTFLMQGYGRSSATVLLPLAIKFDSPRIAEALIDSGADVSDDKNIISAITYLHDERETEYVKWLLDAGADPNTEPSAIAMRGVNEETAKLLIEAGADVDGSDDALFTWVRRSSPDMIKLLLASGADPKVENIHGETPFDVASYQDNTSEMRKIKKHLRKAGGGGLNFHNVTRGITYAFYGIGALVIIGVLSQ